MFRPEPSANGRIGHPPPPGSDPALPLASHAAPRQPTAAERGIKRMCDIAGALVLLMLFSPLYLAVALCVRLSMGRPVHFSQARLGIGGQSFRFYKFRSMVRDSEHALDEVLFDSDAARTQWETFQKLEADPRITPVGQVLRRFSLDELPQLWNVLKGDMSLVGPRPCLERQRSLYGSRWPCYCAMRPGLTGLWQVSGRNRLPYAARVDLDAYYVAHWSLWLDLKILLRTVAVVLTGDGSK